MDGDVIAEKPAEDDEDEKWVDEECKDANKN
jgi:hypothetical protein